ncbi:MAG: hypothetical protein Q4E65_10320 [Clostridia bacterium]|nr:hypothetical protein [Clostridia bacterium]
MENTNGSAPLQADFLDLRHTLAEVAGSRFTLLLASCMTLFTLSRAAALYRLSSEMGLYWCVPGGLLTLLCLFCAVVLWMLYAQGRNGFLKPGLIKALRALPIAETVLAVMACLLMAAVLIVVIFSNTTVLSSLSQLSAELDGTFFRFSEYALARLGAFGMQIVTGITVAAAVLLLFCTLRYCMLTSFLKALSAMESHNAARRTCLGFVSTASLVMGVLALGAGALMLSHNPFAAASMLLYALTLFCGGLLLCKLARELNFLYTYYSKLNRAAQKRAAGIRAQEEALKNAPLMLPATDKTPEEVDDIPAAADAPAVIHAQAPAEEPPEAPAEEGEAAPDQEPDEAPAEEPAAEAQQNETLDV